MADASLCLVSTRTAAICCATKMLPIAEVHRLAEAIPPHVATAWVLLLAAALTLISGLVRGGRSFARWIPALVFVIASALLLWPLSAAVPPLLRLGVAAFAGAALGMHAVLHFREWAAANDILGGTRRGARVYLGAAMIVATV